MIGEVPPVDEVIDPPPDPSRGSDDPMNDLDDEYFWTQTIQDQSSLLPRQFPSLNYINQGILLCDTQVDKGMLGAVDPTYCRYTYPVGTAKFEPVTDQDILDHFDPLSFFLLCT